ncbi:MAG: hypothetical protein ABL308_14425 [Oceanicaulis sp.]
MADVEAGPDEAPEPKRYTFWSWLAMLAASAVALTVGFFSMGLWLPNMMTFAGAQASGAEPNAAYWTVFTFMSAGPACAAIGFVGGWIAFTLFRAPKTGAKLAFYLPVVWTVALFAWLALVTALPFCEDSLTCGL